MPATGQPPGDLSTHHRGRHDVCQRFIIGPAHIALLAALTIALTLAARGPNILPGDVVIGRWVQRWNIPGLPRLVDFANAFGSTKVAVPLSVVLVVTLLLAHHRREAMILVAVSVIRPLNAVLKSLCESPRPGDDLIRVDHAVSGWGYPSGHAMGITLFCGAIIWVACRITAPGWARRSIIALALGLILLTGFARVYVGAHWPSDVLGGYLWGITLLVLVHATFARWDHLQWSWRRFGRASVAQVPSRQGPPTETDVP